MRLPLLPHCACREWFEPGSRRGGSNSPLALWAAGGLAGAVSWLSVYPFDVIKTRCQAAAAARSPYKGDGSFVCIAHALCCVVWATHGPWQEGDGAQTPKLPAQLPPMRPLSICHDPHAP